MSRKLIMRNILFIFIAIVSLGCKKTQNLPENENEIFKESEPILDSIMTVQLYENEELSVQLFDKHDLTEHDLYIDCDGGSQLADYFLIELIDKDTFLKNKSLAVNCLFIDTIAISKKEGILKLPCSSGEVDFIDNLLDGYDYKEYNYLGQIESLNAYLIYGIYWEDWNYFLVDRKSGKTLQTFLNIPYLSADEKYVVSIDFDNIEGTTFIDLYEVTGTKNIDPLIGMYIKKWVPIDPKEFIYWANDNYLYLSVVHSSDYWAAEGNYTGLDQYIRLKPKAADS